MKNLDALSCTVCPKAGCQSMKVLKRKNAKCKLEQVSTCTCSMKHRPALNYKHRTCETVSFQICFPFLVSLCAAVALVLGSYLFRSAVIYWIVAALTLALVTNLGFILLLEFITRTHW